MVLLESSTPPTRGTGLSPAKPYITSLGALAQPYAPGGCLVRAVSGLSAQPPSPSDSLFLGDVLTTDLSPTFQPLGRVLMGRGRFLGQGSHTPAPLCDD